MSSKTNELPFQNDMIGHLLANGWLLGKPENYNRELALYPEDLLGFVQETQDVQWQKFPVPPKQEQDDIADYVEKSLTRFNTLSERAGKQVELLNERRTALISAAVTGKIDVRYFKTTGV